MLFVCQAVVDNNLVLVRLLHIHGADINKPDVDTWTPLHAAAANGCHTIVAYLLAHGADRNKRTEDGETPLDLVEEEDVDTMAEFKNSKEETEKLRRLSAVVVDRRQEKKEPAWVRRMSLQEAARKESVTQGQEKEPDTRRKGSAWVGKDEIPEEEETDEDLEEEVDKTKTQREEKKISVPVVSEQSKPAASQKISTTTIIVSKDDDSSKLKEQSSTDTSKLKEVCNSKSKEDCNSKTTRQRRQGRLELHLEDQPEGIRSQFLSVTTDSSNFKKNKSPTDNKPKTVKMSENSNSIKFSENEKLSTSSSSKER